MSTPRSAAETTALRRRVPVAAAVVAVLLLLVVALLADFGRPPAAPGSATGRPNIIVVLTDDLDVELWQQLALHDTIGGRHFTEAFVTSPLCCPSKASILTGLYAHNHGVMANNPPQGGLYAALRNGLEDSTLPVWLQQAGYRTGFMGRYLVGYGSRDAGPSYVPPGWDRWVGRVSPTPAGYRDIEFSFDGKVGSLAGNEGWHYLPEARAFMRSAGAQPYFLLLATMAPHAPWGGRGYPGDPARRAATMRPIELLVTELIGEMGPNTYLFFTSDNGYHLEPEPGKSTPYDSDTRVPLVVVGPGVTAGTDDHFALNIDLAPTIAELAGIEPPDPVDGVSLVPLLRGESPPWREEFTIELLGFTAVRTQDALEIHWADGRVERQPL
ncbi:MAG TPA: sulfatase-like hydrolase/transferase [Candidatus Limnocylindria bacterium]|jgi:arylsulfatase A-like enzyme